MNAQLHIFASVLIGFLIGYPCYLIVAATMRP